MKGKGTVGQGRRKSLCSIFMHTPMLMRKSKYDSFLHGKYVTEVAHRGARKVKIFTIYGLFSILKVI